VALFDLGVDKEDELLAALILPLQPGSDGFSGATDPLENQAA
jgi:hypothetical protein